MQLSKSFSIDELIVTDTGIYNTPGQDELEKLLYLATFILQPIRDKFGKLQVTSGFRSKLVNVAVGGASTSQHQLGEAADFIPLEASLEEVFAWAKDNLQYSQIIIEQKKDIVTGKIKRWIHIALPRIGKQNMVAMTFKDGIYANV